MSTGRSSRGNEDPGRDAAWLARVAAGGPDGQEALWALMAVYDRLFLVRLRQLPLGEDEASDALVRFWVKVARRAGTFDASRGTAAAWLWTVFGGESIDAWNRQKKDRGRLSFGDLEANEGVPAEPDVPMWADAPQRDILLWRCVVKAMKALYRKHPAGAVLLWKRSALDWKPEELAQAEGKPTGSIKNTLVDVRKLAYDLLKPCYEGRALPR